MLDFLQQQKAITAGNAGTAVPQALELMHKRVLSRYLAEIPSDYATFIRDRTKETRIKEHLRVVYGRNPNEHELRTVLRRLITLAENSTHSREEIEDRPRRTQFKLDRWKEAPRCEICGLLFPTADAATVDHVLPFSFGGEDHESNWQLVCRLCNDQKSRRFGCADLSRTSLVENANFFNIPASEQLQNLLRKNDSTRYELFEAYSRRCCDCVRRSIERKLLIIPISLERMIHVENLAVVCEECAVKRKVRKEHRIK